MPVDEKCHQLAAHFLPDGSENEKTELAEMIQWIVELQLLDPTRKGGFQCKARS